MINETQPIFKTLKKYFLTKENDLFVLRLYSILGICFLPIFGYVFIRVKPDAIEYLSHRGIIAFYWFITLILSYKVEAVKKYMSFFTYFGVYMFMYWIIWICKVNHFSPEYSIGYFLSFCSVAILFNDRISLGFFVFTVVPLTAFAMYSTPVLEMNATILFLSISAIAFVYLIIISAKSKINRQLELLNQTLEEKVTERTRHAEMKTKELGLKNQELERFASIASHDLKSPLRTISSFVSLIDRKTKKMEDEAIQEYSVFIQDGVQRMTQTIDDLLEYSRMGTAGMKLKEVDIKQLLEVVLNGIGNTVNRPDVQLDLPEQLPEKIICESRQMEQLFQNLIENALKFNRSKLKKVMIEFEEESDFWIFHVKDNGIGMPQKSLKSIFEMFSRLHGMKEFPGTGIGLGTCKKIVENHQGEINVSSELNKGTIFTFSISKHLQLTLKPNERVNILDEVEA